MQRRPVAARYVVGDIAEVPMALEVDHHQFGKLVEVDRAAVLAQQGVDGIGIKWRDLHGLSPQLLRNV
ncbi:hypothetical protein D3C86_2268550 [compost metagenome]